jgi:prepilin peptidase CpaA
MSNMLNTLNMLNMTNITLARASALVLAAIACAIDVRTRRIPNVLTFGAAACALVFHLAVGGAGGLADALLGWLVGTALLLAPYALGGMGAGDVKLLGAVGAWLGPGDAFWAAMYTGIAGGALGLVVACAHGYLGQAWRNIRMALMHWRIFGLESVPELTLETSKGPRLAYAAPILVGTLVTLWLR